MRTISEPAWASSMHCLAVPAASAVSVLVIDCTTTGAPPPAGTRPIGTATVGRRGARGEGSGADGARLTGEILACAYATGPALEPPLLAPVRSMYDDEDDDEAIAALDALASEADWDLPPESRAVLVDSLKSDDPL